MFLSSLEPVGLLNPKSEIRNPKQIQKPNGEMPKAIAPILPWASRSVPPCLAQEGRLVGRGTFCAPQFQNSCSRTVERASGDFKPGEIGTVINLKFETQKF